MTLAVSIGSVIVVAIVILSIIGYARQYKKVGPNEALIITGIRPHTITMPDGTQKEIGYRIRIGGGAFINPLKQKIEILSLKVHTLEFTISDAMTKNGVKCAISGSAQVKIDGNETAIVLAAEQFSAGDGQEIREISLKTLEGHIRNITGSLVLEEVNKKRKEFASQVLKESGSEFTNMGLKVVAFALTDIKDSEGYLDALGAPIIMQVKHEAEIAEAEARRDAIIKSAQADKEAEIAKLAAKADVAKAEKELETQRIQYQAEINQKKAGADFSYDLERQKINQLIKKEEFKVKMMEKESEIELQMKEIERAEKELDAKVKKPAEAKKFATATEAVGKADAMKSEADAEAHQIRLRGEAEALTMLKKAQSWEQYNQAAMLQMLIEVLPDLAREISEPLSKVEKIVMVNSGDGNGFGASKITSEVAGILAQLPTVIKTLSGVDLTDYFKKQEKPQITDGNKKDEQEHKRFEEKKKKKN